MNKKKYVVGIVIAITVTLIMVFSTFYVAKEVNHRCSGEGCYICLEIQTFSQILKTLQGALKTGINLLLPVCFLLTILNKRNTLLGAITLISLKVKLTD